MIMTMNKYFKMEEFLKSETADKLGIENKFEDPMHDLRIKELVRCILTPLREKFGRIKISSGYRNQALNKAVGGVPTSNHTKGMASDCVFLDANIDDVWEYLKVSGIKFTEAGLYKSRGFIHLAFDRYNLKNKMFIK